MSQNTKEKIYQTAISLFAQNGYTGTSIRKICNMAGVNIALIKYYFGSKEGIYNEIMENHFAILKESIESMITEESTLIERLNIAIERISRLIHNNQDIFLIIIRDLISTNNPNRGEKFRHMLPILELIWGPIGDQVTREILPGIPLDCAGMAMNGMIFAPLLFKNLFENLGIREFTEKFLELYTQSITHIYLNGIQSFIDENKDI